MPLHLQGSPGKVISTETQETATLHGFLFHNICSFPTAMLCGPRLALGASYVERDLAYVHKPLLCHGVDTGEDKRKPEQVSLEL